MTAALDPILADATAAAARIVAHLNSDAPKTYGADCQEPNRDDWERASDAECIGRAADEVWLPGT